MLRVDKMSGDAARTGKFKIKKRIKKKINRGQWGFQKKIQKKREQNGSV